MASIFVGSAPARLVLVGSFAMALAVGLWTWGTWWGWGFFAFAFMTQVTSATDVLRQGSFPIYPSRTALFFVSSALAILFYFPTIFRLVRGREAGLRARRDRKWFSRQLLGVSR